MSEGNMILDYRNKINRLILILLLMELQTIVTLSVFGIILGYYDIQLNVVGLIDTFVAPSCGEVRIGG